ASRRLGTTTVLQSSLNDVRDGDRFDSERTTEVGRPLMDASEIRQMTKYRQAVAIISNAPPVRLTYPKFAKTESPPLSEREMRFQSTENPKSLVPPSTSELTESSITQASAIHREKIEPERPQNPEAGKTMQTRWKEVNMAITAPPSQKLEFEPEYDLNSLDEEQAPLFDLGSREM